MYDPPTTCRLSKNLRNLLKVSGFNVRTDLCTKLIESLPSANFDTEFEKIVGRIVDLLTTRCENGRGIDDKLIDYVIHNYLEDGDRPIHDADDEGSVFNLVSAFDVPHCIYDAQRQRFVVNDRKKSLLGAEKEDDQPAAAITNKFGMFSERYEHVMQRTRRNFKRKSSALEGFRLETIDKLLGSKFKSNCGERGDKDYNEKVLYLGMINQTGPHQYWLEDPHEAVQLDLTYAKYFGGLFVDKSIVLVHGRYDGTKNVLQVVTMALPPGETYEESKIWFENCNYFTIGKEEHLRESVRLQRRMQENSDSYIYFFANVWLDKEKTLEKIRAILDGLASSDGNNQAPMALVFVGNFLSEPLDRIDDLSRLRDGFVRLAAIIGERREFAGLARTRFVFVPSNRDPMRSPLFPRFPLPKSIVDTMKNVPNAIFATNPCRIQCFTREIVVFAYDMVQAFVGNAINDLPTGQQVADSLARTIICQGHLAPFSPDLCPIFWDYNHSFTLYPLPHLIINNSNGCRTFTSNYKGCTFTNVGSFTSSQFEFVGYNPCANEVEECKI